MRYTIGQVSAQFGLPVSTLRYYDRQGLFPHMQRVSGVRKFGEQRYPAFYGMVRAGERHLSAALRIVSEAARGSRGRDRTHGAGAGYAQVQMLVL